MKVHLVDGTYELFRAYFAMPSSTAPDGREVRAVRGLIQTLLVLLRQDDVSHVACAFDHTIPSFRNELFDGYKTGADVPADLIAQFDLAEQAASALGLVVWPMVEFEADDAIATATQRWVDDSELAQVVICSPDKDLMQLVMADRVVCLDRRNNIFYDEAGVRAKFGINPASIPDYLALVGDAADGIPGISGWGAKSSSAVLNRYGHIESIPGSAADWDVTVRGATSLASALAEHQEDALLYRRLATLRTDVPLKETLADLKWKGVRRPVYQTMCKDLGLDRLISLPHRWDDS